MREKRLFISIDIQKCPILGSLQHSLDKAGSTKLVHQIDKAGSTTSFSSNDPFPSVRLFAKKLKLFVNDSNSNENENVDVTG